MYVITCMYVKVSEPSLRFYREVIWLWASEETVWVRNPHRLPPVLMEKGIPLQCHEVLPGIEQAPIQQAPKRHGLDVRTVTLLHHPGGDTYSIHEYTW